MSSLALYEPRRGHEPPQAPARGIAIESEQALMGAVLNASELGDEQPLRDTVLLQPHHFYEPVHERLWTVIRALSDEGKRPGMLGVWDGIKGDPALHELGGLRYLTDLLNRAPPPAYTRDYAEQVLAAWHARELHRLALAAARGVEEGAPAAETLAGLRTALDLLENEAAPEDASFIDARSSGYETLERVEREVAIGKPKGAPCGLSCIDTRVGGLMPGSLIILGGRPGMGKTALLGNILYGAAVASPMKLFAGISLEMSHQQLSTRALSRLTADDDEPVEYQKVEKSTVNAFELRQLHEVAPRLPDNLILRDKAGVSVEDVRRAVWALRRRAAAQGRELAAVGIDYLQIMRRVRSEGRNDAAIISDMTAALKTLAREAGLCIVLLSQLSRAVEQREDKRPQLSDLRESGGIEQDADAVLFAFREAYYLAKAEPRAETPEHLQWEIDVADKRRRLEVIIGKNRHGAEGVEVQEYDPAVDRIRNTRGYA